MRRKPAACSKVLSPRRGTFANGLAIRERAVGVAVFDDVFRQHGVQARHAREQRRRSRVDIHAHRVDAVFDRGIERARQARWLTSC